MSRKKSFTEHRLVEGIRNNSRDVLQYLYFEMPPVIYRDVLRYHGSKEVAGDYFHELMIKAGANLKAASKRKVISLIKNVTVKCSVPLTIMPLAKWDLERRYGQVGLTFSKRAFAQKETKILAICGNGLAFQSDIYQWLELITTFLVYAKPWPISTLRR